MNAFQLAITSFIQGYREGAAEKVDFGSIFPGTKAQEEQSLQQDTGSSSDFEEKGHINPNKICRSEDAAVIPDAISDTDVSGPRQIRDSPASWAPKQSKARVRQLHDALPGRDAMKLATHATAGECKGVGDPSHIGGGTAEGAIEGEAELPEAQSLEVHNSVFHSKTDEPASAGSKKSPLSRSKACLERNEKPEVLEALLHAEKLAEDLLKPGRMSLDRRKQLEEAVAKAEAAMGSSSPFAGKSIKE